MVRNLNIVENELSGNGTGIRLEDVQGTAVLDNNITGASDTGIALLAARHDVDTVVVRGNTITSGEGPAIRIEAGAKAISGVRIERNTFQGNGSGVSSEVESLVLDSRLNWWGDSSGPSGGSEGGHGRQRLFPGIWVRKVQPLASSGATARGVRDHHPGHQ